MAELSHSLLTAGRSVASAAAWVGGKVADAYRTVDPDVSRHLVQLPLLSYHLFANREVVVEAQESDGHPPLIFVHGLGANRGAFLPMAGYLRLHGRRRGYRIDFRGAESLDSMADMLGEFVLEVMRANDVTEVDMVAHSLGGIIARLAIRDYGLEDAVSTLVTLGTPHHGTYPARYANTEILKALRPDSELMQELAGEPLPSTIRAVALWSRNDLFVLPPESATLDGATAVEVTPFTHYSYLIHPRAWEEVRRALDEG